MNDAETTAKIWQDGAMWMLHRVLEVPASVRAALDPKDPETISYMGKSVSHYAALYASHYATLYDSQEAER